MPYPFAKEFRKPLRWFTSDTHFGHSKIISYCARPFKTSKDMDEVLIANWNERIQEQDEVFFLGDFALGGLDYQQQIFDSLNGQKILIRGNYDGSISRMKAVGFDHVFESAFIKINGFDVYLVHKPPVCPDIFTIHGHIHEKAGPFFIKKNLNVSVDAWRFKPVNETQIDRLIRKYIRENKHV